MGDMNKEYVLTIFSENHVGLLSQIATVFTCRNINIESLTTVRSAVEGIHRFTITVNTDNDRMDNLVKQIEKKIEVLKAFVCQPDEQMADERELLKEFVK